MDFDLKQQYIVAAHIFFQQISQQFFGFLDIARCYQFLCLVLILSFIQGFKYIEPGSEDEKRSDEKICDEFNFSEY